jgi:membrane dipeptidase
MMSSIVDAHNDLLIELAFRRHEQRPFERYWLEHLIRGGVKLQVCPVFAVDRPAEERVRAALEQIAAFHRAAAECRDRVRVIYTREDLDEVLETDVIGLMLSMEGVEPFEQDPKLVETFYDFGVRMAGLTWNAANRFASGGADEGDADHGLTADGRSLVEHMQRRGYVIDLAHASQKTFRHLLELSNGVPPVLSHAGCRSVFDTPRNVSDEQLSALADAGGVVGVMLLPLTVDLNEPTLDRAVDHIEHAADVMGDEHVGIGGDFFAQLARSGAVPQHALAALPAAQRTANMALDASVEGLEGPQDFDNLVSALRRRGWRDGRMDALLHGNFVRVLRQALPTASAT